jgi:hypothetical protein
MAKIFRKIRQKFLSEGRFARYLIYAAGEIVLLVIGILVALAINNANQQRILREKEHVYLTGLKNEFRTSKRKLEELMKVNRHNYEGAKEIIACISEDIASPGEQQFAELLYNTFAFDVSFNPNNSLLNEMISSGSLKDISNPVLRKELTNWVSTIEDIAKQENELAVQRVKVLDMFRSADLSIRTIFDLTGVSAGTIGLPEDSVHQSNLKLLDSREFENNVLMFIITCYATETAHYEPLMADLDSILELIDGEIAE